MFLDNKSYNIINDTKHKSLAPPDTPSLCWLPVWSHTDVGWPIP